MEVKPELFEIKDRTGNVIHPMYRVSRDGRVWSLKGKDKEGKVIKKNHSLSGNMIGLTDKKKELVHVLIANTFIPNPLNHPYIKHIEGTEDNVENLMWVSRIEVANNTNREKKIIQKDIDGNILNTYDSITKASNSINVERSAISKVVTEVNHNSGGYIWEYAEDKDKIKPIIDLTDVSLCKSIEEFPKYYVFRDGRVYSTLNNSFMTVTIPKGTKQPYVSFRNNGSNCNRLISKLVADAFLDNPSGKTRVKFIGEKTNYSVENLVWV